MVLLKASCLLQDDVPLCIWVLPLVVCVRPTCGTNVTWTRRRRTAT